jgi:hydrogenase maturation factor
MDVEHYFLRYAFPCAHILEEWGELTKEELDELKDCVVLNKPVSRERLEKVFFRAFEKIKDFKEDYWHMDVIKEYWQVQHNVEIKNGVGTYATAPESFKNLSKVFKAKVLEVKNGTLLVEYENGKRRVFNDFVQDALIGDFVFIHFGYAAEMASKK